MRHLVLLHSPRVGPSFWHPVADLLCAAGLRTHTPRLPSLEMSYPPYWLVHAAAIASGLPDDGDVVLAAHSGAGVLLPAIGRLARNRNVAARIAGYVFVDCDLPRDGMSRLELFSDPAEAQQLRTAAHDNWLSQFTDRQLARLITDAAIRAAFIAEQPLLSINVYEEPLLVPDDWPDAPCAYLQLSSFYSHSVATAQANRWSLANLNAHHFLPLTAPDRVAATLAGFVEGLPDSSKEC